MNNTYFTKKILEKLFLELLFDGPKSFFTNNEVVSEIFNQISTDMDEDSEEFKSYIDSTIERFISQMNIVDKKRLLREFSKEYKFYEYVDEQNRSFDEYQELDFEEVFHKVKMEFDIEIENGKFPSILYCFLYEKAYHFCEYYGSYNIFEKDLFNNILNKVS